MKRLFTFLTLLLIHTFSFGQKTVELSKKYFLDFNNLEHFDKGTDVLELKERVNYELFLKVKEDYNRFKHPSEEEKRIAYETKTFKGEKGEYILNNEYQQFHFNVNEIGLISGIANLIQTENGYTYFWKFNFDTGRLKYAELKKELSGKPIRKVEINDSLFVMQFFDINTGNFTGKRIIRNVKDYNNSIEILYDENENIRREEDRLQKIRKTFYKNGKPESYQNLLTEESIKYDDMGRKTQHSYPTKDKKWCNEYYENGLIINKNCRNSDDSQRTQYYYKNGKLEKYEVVDYAKDETRKYDKNNKLVSTEKNIYKTKEQ